MQIIKVLAVGAVAVAVSDMVASSDWAKQAKIDALKTQPNLVGDPLIVRGARYGAGGAVVFAAVKVGLFGEGAKKKD